MSTHDAPPVEFENLPPGQLLAAGRIWLERAARDAVDDDVMHPVLGGGPDYQDDSITEQRIMNDRLARLGNIGEAKLAALIGCALIDAARITQEVNAGLAARYGIGSTS